MKFINNHKNYIIVSTIITIILLLGFLFIFSSQILKQDEATVKENQVSNISEEKEEEMVEEPEPAEKFTNVKIAAAGDIMFHSTQKTSGYDEATGTYNFKPFFEDVKPILSAADLTIANFESTLGGPERPFTGYPLFNTPDEAVDALKYAGIDLITTANNHCLDTGSDGLKRTVQVFRESGIDTVGTYDEKPSSRVLLKEIEDIKIAILSYTESTNGLGEKYPKEQLNNMINLMHEERILQDIQEAKKMEADFIITYMHWGDEYVEEPNAKQIELAHLMAQEGVDLILGSHPHVIQKSEVIENDEHNTFVVYSMGNFISNQRKETLGDHREQTEDGIIINIDIEKNHQTNETIIKEVEYVPTWVYRHQDQGSSKYTYRILPIENFLLNDEISESYKTRMKRSYDSTVNKMDHSPI